MAKATPNAGRTFLRKKLSLDPAAIEQRMHSALQFQAPEEDYQPSFSLVTPPASKQLHIPAKRPLETTIRLSPSKQTVGKQPVSADISLLKDSLLSDKSRILAKKAEERFFAKHKVPPLNEFTENGKGIDVQSRNLWEMGDSQGINSQNAELSPTFSSAVFFPPSKTPSNGELKVKIKEYLKDSSKVDISTESRGRNLNISADMHYFLQRHQQLTGPLEVAQRGNSWNDQRKRRTHARKTSQEQEKLSECTFTPVIYSKIPHRMQKMPAPALLHFEAAAIRMSTSSKVEVTEGSKTVLTPKSQQSTAVHTRAHSGSEVGNMLSAKVLSPVAYRFGMDWERLERGGM
jgi:hypothetical protein